MPQHPAAQATGEAEGEEGLEEGANKFLIFNVVPSWMVSFVAHVALIILLALWFMPLPEPKTVALQASDTPADAADDFQIDLNEINFEEDVLDEELSEPQTTNELEVEPPEVEIEDLADFGNLFAEESFETESTELTTSDLSSETSGRTGNARGNALARHGGSAGSEAAVDLALKWIAAHQQEDGSWDFDHRIGGGRHRTSPDPGELADAKFGATAIALLPFLGRGETHVAGEYKDTVHKGLTFLLKHAYSRRGAVSYRDRGTMYSHGLVSIVLCEAYAMTKDPKLKSFAQGTIDYIEAVQDQSGGGWRYNEGQAGDTSAVGWQIMALKSANLAGLKVNKSTLKKAEKFLDNVSTNYGAYYGYITPPARGERGTLARNSVGLLCRMYMGWGKGHQGLEDGMSLLNEKGPDVDNKCNMYYNYYATQAMKHWGGDAWKKWNPKMRDFLIASQSKQGPTEGSWHWDNGHETKKGGRLYNTAMACMTLEVYYRYLPLYGDDASNEEFKYE